MTKKTKQIETATEQELMEFNPWMCQVYTADIKRHISEVSKAVKPNPKPIYNGILLTLHDGLLTITGSNEKTYVEYDVPLLGCTTNETKTIVVDKKFVKTIKNFEHDFMTLEGLDASSLAIRYYQDNLFLKCLEGNEYSENLNEIKAAKYTPIFELGSSDLLTIKNEVAFAASRHDFRKVLEGVNLTTNTMIETKHENRKSKSKKTKKSYLIASATDAYRLAQKELPHIESKDMDITVPADVFNFSKLFDKETKIQVQANEKYVIFEGGNVRIISTLYDGNYPDIKKIFPKSFDITAEFDSALLLNRLKMIGETFSNNQVEVVKFTTGADLHSFEVSGFLKELGSATLNLQTISYDGDPIKITFNGNYMVDAVKTFGKDKTIKMEFISNKKPIKVTCPEVPGLCQLVVPLREH